MTVSRITIFAHICLASLLLCTTTWAQGADSPSQAFEAGGTIPKENLPAWPFLYGAYFFFWALLFGYMVFTWSRSAQINTRIAQLDARLDQLDTELERIDGAGK